MPTGLIHNLRVAGEFHGQAYDLAARPGGYLIDFLVLHNKAFIIGTPLIGIHHHCVVIDLALRHHDQLDGVVQGFDLQLRIIAEYGQQHSISRRYADGNIALSGLNLERLDALDRINGPACDFVRDIGHHVSALLLQMYSSKPGFAKNAVAEFPRRRAFDGGPDRGAQHIAPACRMALGPSGVVLAVPLALRRRMWSAGRRCRPKSHAPGSGSPAHRRES